MDTIIYLGSTTAGFEFAITDSGVGLWKHIGDFYWQKGSPTYNFPNVSFTY